MNELTAYCVIACTFIIMAFGGIAYEKHGEHQLQIEAMKSGLVQKVDPESNKIIWTRP